MADWVRGREPVVGPPDRQLAPEAAFDYATRSLLILLTDFQNPAAPLSRAAVGRGLPALARRLGQGNPL